MPKLTASTKTTIMFSLVWKNVQIYSKALSCEGVKIVTAMYEYKNGAKCPCKFF